MLGDFAAPHINLDIIGVHGLDGWKLRLGEALLADYTVVARTMQPPDPSTRRAPVVRAHKRASPCASLPELLDRCLSASRPARWRELRIHSALQGPTVTGPQELA